MKVLIDSCAGTRLATALRKAGQDVDFVGEWPTDPGDSEVLARAQQQGRVVITRDKDFGDLIFRDGHPHAGLVRLVRLTPDEEIEACLVVLQNHSDKLANGFVITVDRNRVRFRNG